MEDATEGAMGGRTREIEVREHYFEDDGRIPNNPVLPLLVCPQALGEPDLSPPRCKELLAENGWGGAWINGGFSYHHYHSKAHEVLCVMSGEARIALGGPEGTTVEVKAGDVVVIPAGVEHCDAGSSSDFAVLGTHPRDQNSYGLRTGEEGERQKSWGTSATAHCPPPIFCSGQEDHSSTGDRASLQRNLTPAVATAGAGCIAGTGRIRGVPTGWRGRAAASGKGWKPSTRPHRPHRKRNGANLRSRHLLEVYPRKLYVARYGGDAVGSHSPNK